MIKTVSLELAKKMKELGFPQKDCGNYWIEPEDKTSHQLFPYDWQIVTKDGSAWTLQDEADSDNKTWHPIYAAPTAEEVLEQLPKYVEIKRRVYWLGITKDQEEGCFIYYKTEDHLPGHTLNFELWETLTETASQMWVHLKEQKLI